MLKFFLNISKKYIKMQQERQRERIFQKEVRKIGSIKKYLKMQNGNIERIEKEESWLDV